MKKKYGSLSLDSLIHLKCVKCNKCCIETQIVPIFPVDMKFLCDHFEMQPQEIIKKFCDIKLSRDDNFPILILKNSNDSCVFSKNNECILGDNRPSTCRLKPFKRSKEICKCGEFNYTLDTTNCINYESNITSITTVRDYFGTRTVEIEEVTQKWNELYNTLDKIIQPTYSNIVRRLDTETIRDLTNIVIHYMYEDIRYSNNYYEIINYSYNATLQTINNIVCNPTH